MIIEEGAMQTEVFVVISGRLEVRARQEDGSTALLAQVGPGETLGEISPFQPRPGRGDGSRRWSSASSGASPTNR